MSAPRAGRDRDAELTRLLAADPTLTDAELAGRLGLGRHAVKHDRARLGLRKRATPAEPVTDDVIATVYRATASVLGHDPTADELVERLGLTRRTVLERCSRLGLRCRSRRARDRRSA